MLEVLMVEELERLIQETLNLRDKFYSKNKQWLQGMSKEHRYPSGRNSEIDDGSE